MPKQVFELAKELEIPALELVELLKSKGYAVRNHMSTLSDEEVISLNNELRPKTSTVDSESKTVKKKVIKKKVVKTVKKDASLDRETPLAAQPESSPEPLDVESSDLATSISDATTQSPSPVDGVDIAQPMQNPVVRKKTVLRRKGEEGDEDEGSLVGTLSAQAGIDINEPVEKSSMSVSRGLRVVSRPTSSSPQASGVQTLSPEGDHNDSQTTDKKLDFYQTPKMHRFTPVFIPEKTPETAQTATPSSHEIPYEDMTDDEKELSSKKRMGDLAAMMSVKGKAKVRDITQLRADEELKSYDILSGLGRPMFTNVKKKKNYAGPVQKTIITDVKDAKRVILVHKGCTGEELASKLSMKFTELANSCLDINLLLKPTDYLGLKLVTLIANIFSYRVEDRAFSEEKILNTEVMTEESKQKYPLRAPVIAIMGHVDHGKTSLLDFIRKAKVASGEAGGITQHIGAYTVQVNNSPLTFLDTPGHAAFSAMRQRGADITDIVILVVAADDGVMPQTVESINYCKNSKVPVIVAVNKMDKPGVNPDRIKQKMMEFELTPEEWGGHTQYAHISALTGDGIDGLLEMVALQAEMMDLRANPKAPAEGVVVESKIEVGRGPVATILIQQGTLRKGDCIVVGETCGRARSLMDHTGKMIDAAGPSVPVQILGLDSPPSPGDILNCVKNEREAKKIADNRLTERMALEAAPSKKAVVSLEDFFGTQKQEEGKKILNLIIRSDVHGSYEAIKNAVEVLGNDEVGVKVISGGVGAITDGDILLASNSQGFVLGFNMRPVTTARKLAEQKGVDVRTYSIIYELINDVKLALEGLLAPEFFETYIGRAEVRNVFVVPKAGTIAGSAVIDGKIQRGCNIRLLRDGKIVFDGKLSSLKRFKDDAKEVNQGYECGIALDGFNDIKLQDIFEAYIMEERKRKLDESKVTL